MILPEGNTAWYNEEVAAELATEGYAGLDPGGVGVERKQIAIDLLTDAGYTWETAPTIEGEGEEARLHRGVRASSAWTASRSDSSRWSPRRRRTTRCGRQFASYISGVAQEMGIDLVAIPTDFTKIVDPTCSLSTTRTTTRRTSTCSSSATRSETPRSRPSTARSSARRGDSNNTQYSQRGVRRSSCHLRRGADRGRGVRGNVGDGAADRPRQAPRAAVRHRNPGVLQQPGRSIRSPIRCPACSSSTVCQSSVTAAQ